MAAALNNLKRVDMPLNKETETDKTKKSTNHKLIKRERMQNYTEKRKY